MIKVNLASLSRRRVLKAAGVLAAGVAAPAILNVNSALAAYPDRPIKIVVANTPGGPSDLVARMVAAAIQENSGKTVIIENRGGAGSNIGMGYVARGAADGYTYLLATNAFSINPTLYRTIPYNPTKDFVGVSELASSPNTFVVRSELPAKTIKEFVELARKSPDQFNVSTPPIGTSPQLQATVLKSIEKLPRLEEIVFKRRRRCVGGAAVKDRTIELRIAGTGGPAHQGRHAAVSGGLG